MTASDNPSGGSNEAGGAKGASTGSGVAVSGAPKRVQEEGEREEQEQGGRVGGEGGIRARAYKLCDLLQASVREEERALAAERSCHWAGGGPVGEVRGREGGSRSLLGLTARSEGKATGFQA